jgi:hypothetical protein
MKKTLLITGSIAGLWCLTMLGGGCTKTNTKTVTDTVTVTKTDTLVKIDTVIAPGDTTWKHLRDSLWAYYPINGNTNDSTPNNHVLTLNSGAGLTDDMWGNPNRAMDLPGGTAYGIIQDGENFNPASLTVCFYVLQRSATGYLFAKQDYATDEGATFNIGTDPLNVSDSLGFHVSIGSSSVCTSTPANVFTLYTAASNLPIYRWHQVVFSFNQGVMKIYFNGILAATKTTTQQQVIDCTTGQFILGNWWVGDNRQAANCKMTQLRIYSRALTDHEVGYLYAERL